LGFAVVGLEIGFLLAYRAGWNISLAGLYANVIVALILIPIGIVFFKDQISVTKAVGIVLSIAGIIFISLK
jgi:multidrug transporter EmrE-like cation transporter